MENHDILDATNEVHLWALNYVYIDRINHCLSEFVSQWNNHNLSTVGGRTPLQLWHAGMIENQHSLHNFGMMDVPNLEEYGIGDFTEADFSDLDNNVVVPENEIIVPGILINHIRALVQPMMEDGNNGINHFTNVVNFLTANLPRRQAYSHMYMYDCYKNANYGVNKYEIRNFVPQPFTQC